MNIVALERNSAGTDISVECWSELGTVTCYRNTVTVEEVKERIKDGCSQKLRESVTGYSGVKAVNVNVGYKNVSKEYALLPVWFMNYHYKGKTYSFAMNGQTGKLAGTPPLDMNKLIIACSGLFLAVTTIVTLIGGFLQ